ncbi:MAG TPA: hypothetical protein VK656_05930 [Candidatus Acidoferrum sp.]|nr:hypothetical protein [Candidatus Acidoferrum sp.]
MRVRTFELRLIATALTILWTVMAGLVLLGYRPGGPIDLLVGVAAVPPVLISMGALIWPPAARDDRIFIVTVWIGLLVGLLLVPSIGGVIGQLVGRGSQTLLPSLEAAYPWLLALVGTSLYCGLGLARRVLGASAPRRTRLIRGVALGAVLAIVSGSAFAAVAIGNDVALRDRPALASRFGPTNTSVLPTCDGPLFGGSSARVELSFTADVDGRSLGSAQVAGIRSGTDLRWTADVATDVTLGQFGAARVGTKAWRKDPGRPWATAPATDFDELTLDRQVMDTVFLREERLAAEDRGIEFVEGARARHCRIAIDGDTFFTAFPQVSWFAAGSVDLHRWRGEVDLWIFGDYEVGRVEASINGEAAGLGVTGLQGTIRTTMIATDRDRRVTIAPPV